MTKPLAIVLEVEFLDRLAEPVREGRAKSVSDIIRTALERYDLSNVIIVRPSQLAISVRLPLDVRRNLRKIARLKHTSVGQLVRAAVEAYLPQVESPAAGRLEIPIAAESMARPLFARRSAQRRGRKKRPGSKRKTRSRTMTRKGPKG